MSQSASSKGNQGTNSRRGPQKAHIPFRGDDLEHGKKTGKTVNQVSRDADDFEPFEEVLDQAYMGGNVPRAPHARSKVVNGNPRHGSPVLDDRDENGELSMDIDSPHNSPSAYFKSTLPPHPSSARRVGSSSRALSRGTDVDYDRVPSPKPVPRRSSTDSRPVNPSRLRHEVQNNDHSILEDSPGSEAIDIGNHEYDGNDVDFDEGPSLSSRGGMSFTELAQNEDDEAEDDQSAILVNIDKGKRRAETKENLHEDNADKPPNKTKPKRINKEKPRPSIHETTNRDGLRRSQRRHYPPLEYWRQERVVWGRREKGPGKGPCYVPVIKEIITIPKPPAQPLTKKRKRGGTRPPKSKSESAAPGEPQEEVRIVEVDNPELGWDDETPSHGVIIDVERGEEVQRRVAFTAKMVKPMPAGNSNYLFQKIFGDGDFIAGGQLVIPPGQEKPAKPTKDNTYIFYLIEGAVQFRVHRSTFILATGGMFLVPRGNQYYIENICKRDAKLFFAQARKIVEGEDHAPSVQPRLPTLPRVSIAPRSPPQGAPSA